MCLAAELKAGFRCAPLDLGRLEKGQECLGAPRTGKPVILVMVCSGVMEELVWRSENSCSSPSR